ncbi:General secretion pathway protein D [uncultured Gammaproteobacteria bacterium]|jgi:general secretion pathway protein D|uniref:Type II secretion system protein D n=3 Tax=sulfur-oxidizing symbionts TaxID=32036 RepID=A0A1H6MZK2_9GAMM|nr:MULTISPECIES: type II secretion system secretin GspD [sulfur-oxidizing symbionts]CAC9487217.1 General secretion pathway protein D [uncultured Gammaproteobacteria bacterium]CAB5498429.1 General secretion pathway protein D [Bathymodiolus thermophilus thioautotrophic gill symbiont]CAB5502856.1 General secretion pathway protein D [Bathymodiolus azoricus thioautotrophic gill symbiont]CAC9511482.1 General secretion pathway protein D [uncultured Gammaproteobacteria bacterium]CAC9514969.1 General s
MNKKNQFIYVFLTLLFVLSPVHALTLNLKDTDIRTLINTVSQATDKNFIIDPRVRGKVNVVSNQDINDEKLYQFFASILQVHGYVIIPGDDFDKILPKNATKNTPPNHLADDLIISVVLAVKNVAARELVAILRPLASPHGYLVAYQPSNSIIMTDSTASIKRIKDMVSLLDLKVDDDYEIISLKNSSATELAGVLTSLLIKNRKNPKLTISTNAQSNQIIIGGDKSKRLKARFLISELDKQGESGSTSVIYLKHADAKGILPILQGVAKQIASTAQKNKSASTTNIQADEATNAIVITAPAAITLSVKKVINKLDVERAQVLIEAVIAEITSSDASELGIQWLGAGGDGIGLIDFNGQIPALLGNRSDPSKFASSLKSGASYLVGNHSKDASGKITNALGLVINALNSMGNADILSTPSIVTLDNEDAEIVVGNEVPFITNTQLSSSNSNPFQNFERKNVGLTLKVRPQINEGNGVKLKIEQEVSNVLPSSSAVDVITSKRKIKTTVMVENNKILVLGGMIDNVVHETQMKVPLLGDVPILGHLFRYDTEKTEKRHLLIFIRPTILTKDNIDDISRQKYSYIQARRILENMGEDHFDDLFPDYSAAGKKKTNAEIKSTQKDNKSNQKVGINLEDNKSNQEVDIDLEDNWYEYE